MTFHINEKYSLIALYEFLKLTSSLVDMTLTELDSL